MDGREGVRADIAELQEQTRGGGRRRAMVRPSLLSYPATYLLVGINVVVYLAMFRYSPVPMLVHQHAWSAILTAPFDTTTLVRFGGTDSVLIRQGQWWRLLTGTFVHESLLHIALNMWCLWNLGLFGEPLLGKQGLVWVYALTGTAGMMLSYAWSVFSRQEVLVIGASGAVFGIAGILIVLLSNRKLSLPWAELRALRRQVIFFAVANLAIGMAPQMLTMASGNQLGRFTAMLPRIDNTAHVGGFVCGLALGLPLFPRMTSGRSSYRARQRMTFALAALMLCLIAYALKIAGESGRAGLPVRAGIPVQRDSSSELQIPPLRYGMTSDDNALGNDQPTIMRWGMTTGRGGPERTNPMSQRRDMGHPYC